MKKRPKPSHLRLVKVCGGDPPASMRDVALSIRDNDKDELLCEAARVEAACGSNAYSAFLRKHGCRPDQMQAATIGKLLGGRVRASDGTMQPPLSKADREVLRCIRQRRKDRARRLELVTRLRAAIETFSEMGMEIESGDVLNAAKSDLYTMEIREKIESAVFFLNRFAKEFGDHGKTQSAKNSG
jgi:hypothetical protein